MAMILPAIWIGSAIAGWFVFWPWMLVPITFFSLFVLRRMARMRAAARRNGLSFRRISANMAGENALLIIWNSVLNVAIFGIAAGVHALIGR